MEISGWGRYPRVDAECLYPQSVSELADTVNNSAASLIPMGLARSYGDSALASRVISTRYLDHLVAFDEVSGTLTCSGGATLADILDVMVPRGWFLPVTPGTRFVTVGGAVASDVHGKNHHLEGSFSDHLTSLKVLTVSEGVVECSPTSNIDLFRATCGGMGLTGIVIGASLRLKSIASNRIATTTFRARNLDHALALFAEQRNATYSVAWIDCFSRGDSLGRSLVTIGEHAEGEKMVECPERQLSLPVDMPSLLLNRWTIKAFNHLYFHRQRQDALRSVCHYEPFFYPLDRILNWNRLYGRNGFLQYQFVLPEETGRAGMKAILEKIASTGKGSFLAVLKALGPANDNLLSFPMRGLTLALDFKFDNGLLPILGELDRMVIDMGGRHYLAKDARLPQHVFRKGYPHWEKFVAIRARYGATARFNSLQSLRLGL